MRMAVSPRFANRFLDQSQASPSATVAKTRGSAMVRSSALVNLSPLGGRYASEFQTVEEGQARFNRDWSALGHRAGDQRLKRVLSGHRSRNERAGVPKHGMA